MQTIAEQPGISPVITGMLPHLINLINLINLLVSAVPGFDKQEKVDRDACSAGEPADDPLPRNNPSSD